MLARLSIRDIVLIDQLDLEFADGLTILTGETGAGKSILLDALSLALGARGDGALTRHGEAQGQVTASFDLPPDHPVFAALADQGVRADGELILRRIQLADGRTRAFVNDQSVSAQTLRAVAAGLVEIHGQHDERALLDASTHRALVDAYGGHGALVEATRSASFGLAPRRVRTRSGARPRRRRARRRRLRAPRPRRADRARRPARRGRGARRTPPAHDAGREGRRRHSRGARKSVRRFGDPARPVGDLAPTAAASAAGAGADRAERPGARRGDAGARDRHPGGRIGARRLRLRSARTRKMRGAPVRAARHGAQARDDGRQSAGAGAQIRRRGRRARGGRSAHRRARGRGARRRRPLRQRRRGAVERPRRRPRARWRRRSTPSCRRSSSSGRASPWRSSATIRKTCPTATTAPNSPSRPIPARVPAR